MAKKYKVMMLPKVQKFLRKLDPEQRFFLMAWINKNLEGTETPRKYGGALVGDRKGSWRYRFGNYRIIANINDTELVILVIDINNRKDVYKRK